MRQVQVSNVYQRNYASKRPFLVNRGGARSTKSWSIGQLLVQKFWNEKNKKILICRKTGPALHLSAYKLIIGLLRDYGFYRFVEHDKTHSEITNPYNGSTIKFISIDDPEKIKSTDWNYIWLEEATEFTWEDFLICQTRMSGPTTDDEPNQIILSFNPVDEHGWIEKRLVEHPAFAGKVEVIHSTWRDNPFLSEAYIAVLASLKDQDEAAFQVFSEGTYAVLKNIIYPTYHQVEKFPDSFDEVIYGLDFGFNNPMALIRIGIKDQRDCYLEQKLYQTGLTTGDLVEKLPDLIPESERLCPIYCDSAEPDRIAEIERAGYQALSSDKEVKAGIDFCKRLKFYTLADNVDLNKERTSYKWKTDRNGHVLDEPVKFMDHLMDAKRYAIYTHHKDRVNLAGYA